MVPPDSVAKNVIISLFSLLPLDEKNPPIDRAKLRCNANLAIISCCPALIWNDMEGWNEGWNHHNFWPIEMEDSWQ